MEEDGAWFTKGQLLENMMSKKGDGATLKIATQFWNLLVQQAHAGDVKARVEDDVVMLKVPTRAADGFK